MHSPPRLTLAILERRPDATASVLAGLDPADAAAFLESVPDRLAAPVLAGMAPWSAARCLELLAPAHAAGALQHMAFLDAVSVLRLVGEDGFDLMLKQMPTSTAARFRNSLKYPRGTVGAWMDYSVPTFAADTPAAEALKYAKRPSAKVESHLFVDSAGEFAGAVSIGDLLRSDRRTPLAEIMDRSVRPLSNRAMLTTIASLPDWDTYPMLPVVGRRRNVLGGLTRGGLRKGLSEDRSQQAAPESGPMLAHIFNSFFVSATGLLRVMTEPAEEPARPSARETHDGR